MITASSRKDNKHPLTKKDEKELYLILYSIQRFIDVLRTAIPTSGIKQTQTQTQTQKQIQEDILSTCECALRKDEILQPFHWISSSSSSSSTTRIMESIMIPLLQSLTRYYQQLDATTTTSTTTTTTKTHSTNSSTNDDDNQTKKKKTTKPVAPKGLISLKHYTDIGCFLDILVGWSLPKFYLDQKLQQPSSSQILRKRLPCYKLLLQAGSSSSSGAANNNTLFMEQTLIPFLTLERFQPMFLPRHSMDLIVLCYHSSSSYKHHQQQQQEQAQVYETVLTIPLRIQAYRTLLALSSCPYKTILSKKLSTLTQTHLLDILQNFLGSNDDDNNNTAAISRLATVLQPPTPAIFQQLIPLLQQQSNQQRMASSILWSLLDQSSSPQQTKLLQTQLIPYLLCQENDNHIMNLQQKPTQRLYALLTNTIPTSTGIVYQFCHELLITHSQFSPLLTLLVSSSITKDDERIAYSSDKEQVAWIIRHLLHYYYYYYYSQKSPPITKKKKKEIICQIILQSFQHHDNQTTNDDDDGTTSTSITNKNEDIISSISNDDIMNGNHDSDSMNRWTHTMEQRIKIFIDTILVPPTTTITNDDKSTTSSIWKWLPKELFQSCFTIYLDSSSTSMKYKYMSMMTLPYLCEKIPPSFLLHQDDDDDNDDTSSILQLLNSAIQAHSSIMEQQEKDEEEQNSILSLVVSILVTLLELGSTKRCEAEEELLTSMLPFLQQMTTTHNKNNVDLADMASHAMALISSRSIITTAADDDVLDNEKTKKTVWDELHQVQIDLSSSQPPIRARGMVTLRHLAHAHLLSTEETKKPKITVLDTEYYDSKVDCEPTSNIPMKCFQLALQSLTDEESYVYLAGIQTIVTIADCATNKDVILLQILSAITTGQTTTTTTTKTRLSNPQRLKLTDALHFIIRRRGTAIHTYIPTLLRFLFYHHPHSNKKDTPTSNSQNDLLFNMQKETHTYFQNGRNNNRETEEDDEDNWEKRRIRCQTGGPVFDVEEDELVRAACIHIVAELLSCTTIPQVWINHVPSLLHLCQYALTLTTYSRPICRAAALCCRELYSTMYKSIHESNNTNTEFVTHVLSCGEESLYHTLLQQQQQCMDTATKARCEEALQYRQFLHESGILQAAAFLSQGQIYEQKSHFISNFIQKELSSTNNSQNIDNLLSQNHK